MEPHLSDIAIRFDGLLLGLLILVGASVFALIALVSTVRAWLALPSSAPRWKVAAYSLWWLMAHAVALALLIAYVDHRDAAPTGPDWLDWLAVPWAFFILSGLALILRQVVQRRRESKSAAAG
jgi:hypothetical protein